MPFFDGGRDAEIGQFRGFVPVEEDVVRLDVAVDDPLGVQIVEPLQYPGSQLAQCRGIHRLADQVGKTASIAQFQHHKRVPLVGVIIQAAHNEAAVQRRPVLVFLTEPLGVFQSLIGHEGPHLGDLERIIGVMVAHFVHAAKAALAQFFFNQVFGFARGDAGSLPDVYGGWGRHLGFGDFDGVYFVADDDSAARCYLGAFFGLYEGGTVAAFILHDEVAVEHGDGQVFFGGDGFVGGVEVGPVEAELHAAEGHFPTGFFRR